MKKKINRKTREWKTHIDGTPGIIVLPLNLMIHINYILLIGSICGKNWGEPSKY